MDLFSDLVSAVQSDLTIGAESSLFDPDTVKLAVNRAYVKIGSVHRWAENRDALKTSTIFNQEYYDYPQNWQPDSIWKLRVDGFDYGDPLAFKDYLSEQENSYPAGRTKLWANQRNRYFITADGLPPQVDGDNNIEIWGMRAVDKLVADTDITIFSYNLPEVNEAVVLEATAILKQKGEILQVLRRLYLTGSELLSYQATALVNAAWAKEIAENVKYEKTIPQFDVPDYFAGRGTNGTSVKNKIGNF